MAGSLFSVPIFFIVFRETLEAVIIISVLLGLVEQIAQRFKASPEEEIYRLTCMLLQDAMQVCPYCLK